MINKQEQEIIEKLKKCIGYDAPSITQNQFDSMVNYIMKNKTTVVNSKELLWRLCGCYEGLNFNNVIDIFVDTRDAYYVSELVSYVDGNLDQEYLAKKMIETNDLDFIDKAMSNCGNAMTYSLKADVLEKIRKFYNENSKNDK